MTLWIYCQAEAPVRLYREVENVKSFPCLISHITPSQQPGHSPGCFLGVLWISKFKFRKLNQRISASVQGTPRRGNEHIAQGIALGIMKRWSALWRGKSISVHAFIETLLPFQGAITAANLPRALPWAMRLLGFQPAKRLRAKEERTAFLKH